MERLGERYRDATVKNYQVDCQEQAEVIECVIAYLKSIRENIAKGQGVMFYGPPGTGKDHLMVAMMRQAIRTGHRVVWRNGSDLYGEFRDTFGSQENEHTLIDRYTKSDIFAISDPAPPKGELKPYQTELLFRIVDRRYRDQKPTWVTINAANRGEAEELIGANVIDRLGEGALALPCFWDSYRKGK